VNPEKESGAGKITSEAKIFKLGDLLATDPFQIVESVGMVLKGFI
jgi:hypothetical protein